MRSFEIFSSILAASEKVETFSIIPHQRSLVRYLPEFETSYYGFTKSRCLITAITRRFIPCQVSNEKTFRAANFCFRFLHSSDVPETFYIRNKDMNLEPRSSSRYVNKSD